MRMFFVLLAALIPGIALADADYGEVSFINGWRLPDGSYQAGIKFELNQGWKTYWRVPGPAGIAPEFNWNGSSNIADITIDWPTPQVFDSAGLLTIGYKNNVILPVHITPRDPNQPIDIFLQMDFGVCSDICVPASLDFIDQLNADTANEGKSDIRAALASTPISAKSAGLRQASCNLTPNATGFDLTAELRFNNNRSNSLTIIEYPDPDYWIEIANSDINGRNLTASTTMEYYGSGMMSVNRSDIRITVLDGTGAIEILGCPAKG